MDFLRKPTTPPVISWFDDFGREPNPYAFLSNFYVGTSLIYGDTFFATGEHLFQWLKLKRAEDRAKVAAAKGPGAAKALGRSLQMRPDWEAAKYDAMRLVLALKFTLDRLEGRLLLETGDALLVEGTWWGDDVWGVDLSADPDSPSWRRPGRNWLGALLMARRAELRAEATFGVSPSYGAVTWFARFGKKLKRAPKLSPRTAAQVAEQTSAWDLLGIGAAHGADVWVSQVDTVSSPYPDDENLRTWEEESRESTDDALEGARAAKRADRIDHSQCDHANSKNARARCRRRLNQVMG